MNFNKMDHLGIKSRKHQIISKDVAGLDYPLNPIYLCEEHHR